MTRHQATHGTIFQPGDIVGYAARFLRDTGQFTGAAPQRRGVFVSYAPPFEKSGRITHGRVHWDDEASLIASGKGDYAEADYCSEIRANGSLVALSAIAKVGSARFVLNDL